MKRRSVRDEYYEDIQGNLDRMMSQAKFRGRGPSVAYTNEDGAQNMRRALGKRPYTPEELAALPRTEDGLIELRF